MARMGMAEAEAASVRIDHRLWAARSVSGYYANKRKGFLIFYYY